ncbi:thioredoxin domain-containing protein, partial [Candidatus Saccharibacteria bacterium]|nr:thioredoxin domain-containing protein [Candidatus Saccharibacteria bacterium]
MDGQKEVSVLAAGKKNKETKTKEEKTQVPKEKSGRSVGLIVTLIILGVVIIALAVVLTIILININSNSDSDGDKDDNTSVVDKKEDKKDDKKDSGNDNAGIEKGSADNGYIGDHVRGKRDSEVLVIEYADPQCPGCATLMPKMDSIYKKYKDKVAFIYRHYTIAGHQNARSAAIAAEAAGKQGYFWEMISELFDDRTGWIMETKEDKLADVYANIFKEASNNKGNVTQFKKDLKDSNLGKKVDHDKTLGTKDNLSATPTVIVNGEEVNFYSTTNAQKVIEDAIEDALNG